MFSNLDTENTVISQIICFSHEYIPNFMPKLDFVNKTTVSFFQSVNIKESTILQNRDGALCSTNSIHPFYEELW